jgi:hypothetical protein
MFMSKLQAHLGRLALPVAHNTYTTNVLGNSVRLLRACADNYQLTVLPGAPGAPGTAHLGLHHGHQERAGQQRAPAAGAH